MSENKVPAAPTAEKKEFGTALTKVNDTFLPLIESQMEKNSLDMSPYSRQCVMHAISGINALLDKSGVSWANQQLDKSTISDILIKVACLRLNAAASPREIYFELRNVKSKDDSGKEIWKKQIEMGIEGDGNDAILSNFGRGVKRVCQIWKVREGDDFTYPHFIGLDMAPPQWTPKGSGKIVKVVYPVIMDGKDGKDYVDFYISEREDVRRNLLAHLNNNLMQETFGIAKSKWDATPAQKKEIAAKKQEIFNKAKAHKSLDEALDDPELQPYISPAWTEPFSRESMIERKMRNNAIKKVPKDFGNGAMETMFEEAADETYRATAREIKQFANSEPIDLDVDPDTGELLDPDQPKQPDPEPQGGGEEPEEYPQQAPAEAPSAPQEPPKKEKVKAATPTSSGKSAGGYRPSFL